MLRKSVLGMLLIPLLVASGFGQQFFAPVGQYGGSVIDLRQGLPPIAPSAAIPAQHLAPAAPYTGPQAMPSSVPFPAPHMAPYLPAYPTSQPAPNVAPNLPSELQPGIPQAETPAPPSESPTAEQTAEEAIEETILPEEEAPRAWYYTPIYWFDLWEGNVELGMSGSDGNSETLNYLLGLDAKRETERHILNFDLKYDRKTANSVETAHRMFGEIRWELLFEDSAWTWFFHETTEYDEFKAFDLRLSYDTGLGRCLIKNDDTSLLARSGAGVSHEVGGINDEMVPEAVFGLEFKHKLNERQKLSVSSEYSPDVTDFLDYRLKSRASWEVLLDEETNLSLKVSLLNRYDSTPHGKKANDLDYTLTLLWSF